MFVVKMKNKTIGIMLMNMSINIVKSMLAPCLAACVSLLHFNLGNLLYEKINPLKSERENLWKKLKRAKADEEKKKKIEN